MQARLLCDTGGACPRAGVRTAARARFARACGSDASPIGCAWGLRICGGVSLLIHDLAIPARVPWYAQCRHEGGGTSGGGSGADAVRTARMRRGSTAHATAVAAHWLFCCCGYGTVAQWCLYLRPSACAAADGGCRRRAYLLAICSPFARFIRRIRFIICASA